MNGIIEAVKMLLDRGADMTFVDAVRYVIHVFYMFRETRTRILEV